ncbi:DUF2863 family protein [Accumulibacter sp.]|uniref:DUF2863 family protein n=1 Tax=Accumulibacter sp. TaxID=2053492 RepID=UPI0025E2D7CF|nr:DUF2863 family protein [Accumulibacter sp.]MCM8595079.1 DUF2863 family protein [Accumulibacter sp.]MCM8625462.1 DUF2863 family protein [Accumulibacter sp.]MDS4049225.1 DUF2863 family protein [Accumulibacter sp.]
MKRNRLSSRKRISADATELSRLAIGLADSGSRLEDLFWQERLGELIDRVFQDGTEEDFTGSLDRLFDANPAAHDGLADLIEAHAESGVVASNGQEFDVLLIATPVLAWSRFSIPAATIPKSTLHTLKVHLGAHVCSAGARLSLADYLYSPDQLPHSFVETWQLMRRLGSAALSGTDLVTDASTMPETNRFLSDTRYLLGALVVPRGKALFRWNEADRCTRESVLREWVRQGGPALESLLTGCSYQPLLADAYHAACRSADSASRPYSVSASVAFLQDALGLTPEKLRAVVGGFHDQRLEEYRIGFGPRDGEAIHHGVVWPLLGAEDENSEISGEIETALRKAGVKEIVVLDQRFPYEFCDDCGAPLYPNVEGETVHAEMPEENSSSSPTLH